MYHTNVNTKQGSRRCSTAEALQATNCIDDILRREEEEEGRRTRPRIQKKTRFGCWCCCSFRGWQRGGHQASRTNDVRRALTKGTLQVFMIDAFSVIFVLLACENSSGVRPSRSSRRSLMPMAFCMPPSENSPPGVGVLALKLQYKHSSKDVRGLVLKMYA